MFRFRKFRRAFSYIETIIAVFICLLVLIPTIKINLKQVYTYKKINEYEDNLVLFKNLVNHIEAQNFFSNTNQNLIFHNYGDLKKNLLFKNFSSFDEEIKKDIKFDLEVKINIENIDFYLKNFSANLIEINYKNNKINFSENIIKFKE